MKKTTCELLAPAGNLESAIVAFNSGADAVYCGFSKFNAREMNQNFSFDDMSRLSAYCKKNNKRYYNTFNTLIKEDEIEEFYKTIKEAISLSPDALIVQDIGVAALIKEAFPNQKIHSSTQMAIHNSAGVKWASKNGFDRVILERQITFDELKKIAKKSDCELEVFIHGALCCSLSGCCLFSSWIGGYSGNRGKCKQPCRRRYYDQTKHNENGFYFSTTDLCMIDNMKTLLDLNIASFKIEGRLKRLDYITSTVKAYRKVIDEALELNNNIATSKTIKEAKSILNASPSRLWSSGFFEKENLNTVVAPSRAGICGKLAGHVLSTKNNTVNVQLTSFLKTGDRVRFQNSDASESPSFTLLNFKNLSKVNSTTAKANEIIQIKTDVEVSNNSKLFLVGSSISIPTSTYQKLELFKESFEVETEVEIEEKKIKVSSRIADKFFNQEFDAHLELAKSKVDISNIEKIFLQSANERFTVKSIKIKMDKDYFLAASLLKNIRRNFYEKIFLEFESEKNINIEVEIPTSKIVSDLRDSLIEKCCSKNKKLKIKKEDLICCNKKNFAFYKKKYSNSNFSLPIFNATKEFLGKKIFWQLPLFCSEDDLELLSKKIEELIKYGEKNFILSSLYQLEFFDSIKTADLYLASTYPLPSANSFAAIKLLQYLNEIQLWVELSKEEQKTLFDSLPLELQLRTRQFFAGYPALLSTRAKLTLSDYISDSHGLPFKIEEQQIFSNSLYQLFSLKLFKADSKIDKNILLYFDYQKGEENNEKIDRFNFNYKWV